MDKWTEMRAPISWLKRLPSAAVALLSVHRAAGLWCHRSFCAL